MDKDLMDLSDPMQVFMAVYGGIEAESYSRKISENTARRHGANRAAGKMFASGPTPFGFNDDRLTHNEPEADLIRRGVAMVLDGKSPLAVTQMFRQSGIKPKQSKTGVWAQIGVRDQLTKWRIAAVVEHKGEPVGDGVWEPIVSRDDLEQCRAILLGRKGQKRQASRLLSGVALCVCGEYLSGSNRNGKPHYSCTARQRGLHLDKQHVSITVSTLDDRARSAVVGWFMINKNRERIDDEAQRLADLYSKRDDHRATRTKIQAGFKAGIYTDLEAADEIATANADIAKVEDQIQAMISRSASALMRAETLRELRAWSEAEPVLGESNRGAMTARLMDAFDSLPIADARELVRSVLTIRILPGIGPNRVEIDPN